MFQEWRRGSQNTDRPNGKSGVQLLGPMGKGSKKLALTDIVKATNVIRLAFEDVKPPVNLVRSKPYGVDLTQVMDFRGRLWPDLSTDVSFLCSHHEFAFLTLEAFRYFLPAYLIGSLLAPDALRDNAVDTEIRRVTKSGANLFLELGFKAGRGQTSTGCVPQTDQ